MNPYTVVGSDAAVSAHTCSKSLTGRWQYLSTVPSSAHSQEQCHLSDKYTRVLQQLRTLDKRGDLLGRVLAPKARPAPTVSAWVPGVPPWACEAVPNRIHLFRPCRCSHPGPKAKGTCSASPPGESDR